MKETILEQEKGHYIIVPSSSFIYFFWALYRNFIACMAILFNSRTIDFGYIRYYKTIKEARKYIKG